MDATLLAGTLPGTVAAAGRRLRKPSSPDRNLPRRWEQGDVAFLLAKKFIHDSEFDMQQCYIPCATELHAGHGIAVIGYTGGYWQLAVPVAC